uniref:ECSIT N-terminal domain-containing protein n=1 Tax=Plectus sambesii TaxID=2011161 RepID=A0A914V6P7_9BILA
MEWHGCEPDKEISDMVGLVFGQWNFASKKMKRMMYWRMKLRHSNPFVDRRDIEGKQLRPSSLAKWAMKMICRDPGTVIYEWLTDELENRKEKTWIVCGQSPMQQRLIERHPIDKPLYVNGPFTVY